MTFGQAIEAMKGGACVARSGWNGKGMFLFVNTPRLDGVQPIAVAGLAIVPCICMKTAQNNITVGWLASQVDMLTNDWCVIE